MVNIFNEFESAEFESITDRIDFAIKHGFMCIYNSDGKDVEVQIPWYCKMSDLHPKYVAENMAFGGWISMSKVILVDFSGLSILTRNICLFKNGFSKGTLRAIEQHKDVFKEDSFAIHVDLKDSGWFEYVISSKGQTPNTKTKNKKYGVHRSLNSKKRPYRIQIIKSVEIKDISFTAHIVDKTRELVIYANQDLLNSYIDGFIKHIHGEIIEKFKVLQDCPDNEISWQSEKSIKEFIASIKQEKQREAEFNKRWFESCKPITKVVTESYKGKPLSPEIKTVVSEHKGRIIQYNFACSLCSTTHFKGHLYNIRGYKIHVCQFCYEKIRNIKPFAKVILTNMGGKR